MPGEPLGISGKFASKASRPASAVARAIAGVLLAASAVVVAAAPDAAHAQGGSALFAVGESGGRSRPAAKPVARPKVATANAAAAATANPGAVAVTDARSVAAGSSAAGATPTPAKAVPARAPQAKPKSRRGKTVKRKPAAPVFALNGRWHDTQCIPLTSTTYMPSLYVKRQYVFDDARKAWQLDAVVYNSHTCAINSRLLTYRGDGSYTVTGKSRVAADAYDASFRIDRWSATPETREGVLTLLNGRCGAGDFQQGLPLDLSRTGCSTLGIRSTAQSPRENELVGFSNGKFFLGDRSLALSDERPTQLGSYGLVRTP